MSQSYYYVAPGKQIIIISNVRRSFPRVLYAIINNNHYIVLILITNNDSRDYYITGVVVVLGEHLVVNSKTKKITSA